MAGPQSVVNCAHGSENFSAPVPRRLRVDGGGSLLLTTVIQAQSKGKVFELRTYTTNEGKLDALQARFRDHTTRIFKKHHMTNVGYWVPHG